MIGIALFGIGRAGGIHLVNLLQNRRAKLLYVIETDEQRWEAVRDANNLTQVVRLNASSVDQALNDKNVDAVVISTPTFTHEDLVERSLKAGKAVFCEKPLAETMEATKKLYGLAESTKKPLLVAFNRRFDPSFMNAYRRIRNGEIGHVQQLRTVSRDSPLPALKFLQTSGGHLP